MPAYASASTDWQLECSAIRERGARLLASEQWADCSFLLGAAAVPARAHRLILAMASPVFQAMFYGPVAEGDAPIPVPDIQPEVFNKLLRYVYTDEADLENYKIAFEVYYAAEKYMLPHLQTLCTTYLAVNLVPQIACSIYEFANFIEHKELENKCLEVIKDKTKLVLSPDSTFEELALGTVIHIFSLDTLNIDSELDLLAAAERYILAWQKHVNEMADLNTSSYDVDSQNVSVSNRIDKDTNEVEVDIIKCNGNSNGDIENHDKKISNNRQGADEATAENQDITPSDTKPLQPECSEVVNRARSEATFRFTLNNVSKMEGIVLSPPFYVRDLPWKIETEPFDDDGQKYFGFYVQCNGESKSFTWSCKALIDYTLISHKQDTKPFCRKPGQHYFFSSSSKTWGFPDFMTWNDVLDPENGYVKDDAITLEVHVIAEPPQGLSWYSKSCISCIDIKDESVQAILRKIRFLTLTGKELADYKPKLSLLTDQDILAILMNIVSTESEKPVPNGFSTCRIRRFYYPPRGGTSIFSVQRKW